MPPLIVAWDEEEIQVIDEGNFEDMVVSVVEEFFGSVEGHSSIEVEWKAGSWDYGSQYKIVEPPVMEIIEDRYSLHIEGQSRHGEYLIEMLPSGLFVEQLSNGQRKELDYLTLRAPEVAVNSNEEEIFVKNIPKKIRKRLIQSIPEIET
jgi:hypothetical protein